VERRQLIVLPYSHHLTASKPGAYRAAPGIEGERVTGHRYGGFGMIASLRNDGLQRRTPTAVPGGYRHDATTGAELHGERDRLPAGRDDARERGIARERERGHGSGLTMVGRGGRSEDHDCQGQQGTRRRVHQVLLRARLDIRTSPLLTPIKALEQAQSPASPAVTHSAPRTAQCGGQG